MTTEIITRDNQIIIVGTEIYYSGDMANESGFGVVTDITDTFIFVTLDDGRTIRPHKLSFEPGPGRRFVTKKFRDEERAELLKMLA